jgi:hypothetical protein
VAFTVSHDFKYCLCVYSEQYRIYYYIQATGTLPPLTSTPVSRRPARGTGASPFAACNKTQGIPSFFMSSAPRPTDVHLIQAILIGSPEHSAFTNTRNSLFALQPRHRFGDGCYKYEIFQFHCFHFVVGTTFQHNFCRCDPNFFRTHSTGSKHASVTTGLQFCCFQHERSHQVDPCHTAGRVFCCSQSDCELQWRPWHRHCQHRHIWCPGHHRLYSVCPEFNELSLQCSFRDVWYLGHQIKRSSHNQRFLGCNY